MGTERTEGPYIIGVWGHSKGGEDLSEVLVPLGWGL